MNPNVKKILEDPYLRVEIDWNGSSRAPLPGIWYGQHACVSEGFSLDDPLPKDPGAAILKHQLKSEHSPHFSVLRYSYLILHCAGFPHSVMCQLTRHQDSAHLVQSLRYTGDRFVQFARGERYSVEELFYFRPLSTYQDRKGNRYEYTQEWLGRDRQKSVESAHEYAEKIDAGWSEEHARDGLRYNFRQNFAIAGDLQAVFHWLDQRSKADSQLEIQALAYKALERVKEFAPQLGGWYEENRYGKARLAP